MTSDAYGADAVTTKGVHHLLGFFVQEEAGDVDRQEVLVALFQGDLDRLAESLAEPLALPAQFRHVQEHGIC